MQDLQSLGHAAGTFQKDPKLIAIGLKLAAAETAARTGERIRKPEPPLVLNGVSYYPAAEVVAAIAALAKLDAEKLQEEVPDETQ